MRVRMRVRAHVRACARVRVLVRLLNTIAFTQNKQSLQKRIPSEEKSFRLRQHRDELGTKRSGLSGTVENQAE
jgi:hypothetical protein